jgi:pentatricopeptide repeat protein
VCVASFLTAWSVAMPLCQVILAWTNLGKDNAGKRAQWWLKKLNEHYEMEHDERLRLSVTACNAVIKALVKVGQVKEAENVLVDMMHSENNEKIPFLKPNSESFAMVIHAWLKLDAKESEEFTPVDLCGRAVEWLDELVRREEAGTYGVTTSPELFDGVLKAASKFADVHPEILDLAIATLEKYRTSRHRIDCMAYVWLLEAGIKAFGTPEFDKTRFDFIQLMRDCCHDGLLSNKFVQTLANGPVYYDGWTRGKSALITKELFPDWPLPPEWYRNLPHDYYIPKRKDFRRNNQNVNLRD